MKKAYLFITCFYLTACLGVSLSELSFGSVITMIFEKEDSWEINIVQLKGQLEFTEGQVIEKGFIISVNSNVDISDTLETNKIRVFNQTVEGEYDTIFTFDKSNKQYFYTAYAVFKQSENERFAHGETKNITLQQGWIKANSIQDSTENLSFGRRGGVGGALNNIDKALIALGCQNIDCNPNHATVHIYELDFNSSTNTDSWNNKSEICRLNGQDIFNSRGGISFVINKKFYFGLGLFDVRNGESQFIDQLYCFDSSSCQLESFFVPNNFSLREGAIAFVLNDKAYIGFGRDDSNDLIFSDLWKFDPEEESPFQIVMNNLTNPELKRFNAISFSIGDFGYIGLGRVGVEDRKDFLRFDPLGGVDGQSFYEPISDFDKALSSAVVFVIEDTAYIGLGQEEANNFNLDFWRFNPSTGFENTNTPFPGTGRREALAFSLSNKGFVGTGWDGTSTFDGFWIYIP